MSAAGESSSSEFNPVEDFLLPSQLATTQGRRRLRDHSASDSDDPIGLRRRKRNLWRQQAFSFGAPVLNLPPSAPLVERRPVLAPFAPALLPSAPAPAPSAPVQPSAHVRPMLPPERALLSHAEPILVAIPARAAVPRRRSARKASWSSSSSSSDSIDCYGDIVGDNQQRSLDLNVPIEYASVLHGRHDDAVRRLVDALKSIPAKSSFYIGASIDVVRRWLGDDPGDSLDGDRNPMPGHCQRFTAMRIIAIERRGRLSMALEKRLIAAGKHFDFKRCVNKAVDARGQCQEQPNFMYLCYSRFV